MTMRSSPSHLETRSFEQADNQERPIAKIHSPYSFNHSTRENTIGSTNFKVRICSEKDTAAEFLRG
jgi:hypothetical protein